MCVRKLTASIDRSTIMSSQVSVCGKSLKEDLYLTRRSQSAAASFVGTRSRAALLKSAVGGLAA